VVQFVLVSEVRIIDNGTKSHIDVYIWLFLSVSPQSKVKEGY
jgi:hypothetical protein